MSSLVKARTSALRCPACGHRLASPPPSRCPLCEFGFGDDRVTGVDVTPYARAYSLGEHGWRRMCEWVWFSTGERIKHLALMRASAASRCFARVSILLLALGLGVFQATHVGWRRTAASAATGPTKAAGRGWLHVAAAPRPLPSDQPPEIPVDLWWNPVQAVTVIVTAALAGSLLMWAVLALVRVGVRRAHRKPYRGDERMTAAIHYSTAWVVPVLLGAVVTGLRPVAFLGTMGHWPWCPPDRMFVLAAAVLGGFGVIMWWFWVVRLGATAPAKTRGRVIAFFALGAPSVAVLAISGWWFGLDRLYGPLLDQLRLSF